MPANTPTWTKLYDVTGGTTLAPTGIILEDPDGHIAATWGVGAEILITSHTMNYDDQQTATIAGVESLGNGRVQLNLDVAIRRPTTSVETTDFAVEVALLSRNIVFTTEGLKSDDGGHFWVIHTPEVAQTIEGVDIRGFGQQVRGSLPLHCTHNNMCRVHSVAIPFIFTFATTRAAR